MLEDQIESAIQQALGNLQVNNIVLSLKLEAAEAQVRQLQLQLTRLQDMTPGTPVADNGIDPTTIPAEVVE